MAELNTPRRATPIVALDFPSAHDALALVDRLGARCAFYKVGNELFTASGPAIVTQLRGLGADVFLDLKFHDIPNTVAAGVRSAAALGARLVTVHASGGGAMIAAAVAAAGSKGQCGILAVTVLTSLTDREVASVWGRRPREDEEPLRIESEVIRLAGLAEQSGAHGIVCSGQEAAAVRAAFGDSLALLIPGVRPAGEATHDQARVVTPADAVKRGASYIVLGRAVTGSADPSGAMDRINDEIAAAIG